MLIQCFMNKSQLIEQEGGNLEGSAPLCEPTWQRGDELVDVLDVPLAGVRGHQAVGTRGALWRRRRQPLVSRQVRTLAGLCLLSGKRRVARGRSGGGGGWRLLQWGRGQWAESDWL